MRAFALVLLALAGCNAEPLPVRSTAGAPIGTTATSGPALTSQGAHEINRDYYIGADPNFPRGMQMTPRGVR